MCGAESEGVDLEYSVGSYKRSLVCVKSSEDTPGPGDDLEDDVVVMILAGFMWDASFCFL